MVRPKLLVILVQSEGDPEIDFVAGEVLARETFSILITTAVHISSCYVALPPIVPLSC